MANRILLLCVPVVVGRVTNMPTVTPIATSPEDGCLEPMNMTCATAVVVRDTLQTNATPALMPADGNLLCLMTMTRATAVAVLGITPTNAMPTLTRLDRGFDDVTGNVLALSRFSHNFARDAQLMPVIPMCSPI